MINALKFTFRLSSFYNFEGLIFSYSFYFRKRDIPFSLAKKKRKRRNISTINFLTWWNAAVKKHMINFQKSGFI